ncbi:hypothetical protein EG68_10931 [Paragonimus skrjabini miyazakii]|uniref:Uncharacterized protein n=1 Tax=Paragonimus skrjabini miyazakii TaxID=59628 RepID=A0A8S9YHQ4_9TREM|nr:hypothetical protein EG68_10931 [Paragonimus skrjabini miyazakii]
MGQNGVQVVRVFDSDSATVKWVKMVPKTYLKWWLKASHALEVCSLFSIRLYKEMSDRKDPSNSPNSLSSGNLVVRGPYTVSHDKKH